MKIIVEKLTTVVIHQFEMGWIVKCGKCKGSGIEPTYSSRSCSSCLGAGHRKLTLPEDADLSLDWGPVFCGHCKGTGIEPTYSSRSCQCCDGRGVQAGIFPRVKCGKCHGFGVEPTYSNRVCTAKGCCGRGTIHIDILR